MDETGGYMIPIFTETWGAKTVEIALKASNIIERLTHIICCYGYRVAIAAIPNGLYC